MLLLGAWVGPARVTEIRKKGQEGGRKQLIAVSSPAAVGRVPGPTTILHDRRTHGSEILAGGAVIGQLKHVTPRNGRKVKGHHCCDLSIMQMLDNSLNYHQNFNDAVQCC